MSEIPELINDLAYILMSAGIVTLIFKRLKQPLVLGYIVAGFLVSPHMPYTASIVDTDNVQLWADIGVMFLLFSLGLDFSFKKILKMGASPIISTITIIFCMSMLGLCVGQLFHWPKMDCIFLGGMLAMSSTTIIYKAFDDLGLRQQQFAGLVMSVLILEDILAIVMMVMLSAIASGNDPDGGQMLGSVMKIGFFLVLWLVVGIFAVPEFLRRVRRLINNEVLLIVSLGLCCAMAVFSTKVGFSSAFGAFIMGSILAETIEAEHIIKLVEPVKNLFGAIFFVSVGMMVDVNLIVEYIVPIVSIIIAVMLGQTILSTCGFLLAGQSLKTSMQCSFSLTQIGEFAFILATLGTSLHVTSDFLYPIVVAVSVFTTFTTPYMIRFAEPAYNVVARMLPAKLIARLERHENEGEEKATDELRVMYKGCVKHYFVIMLINSVLCIAIMSLMLYFGQPMIANMVPESWVHPVTALVGLVLCSPFLWMLLRGGADGPEVEKLWRSGSRWRMRMTAYGVLRLLVTVFFVSCFIDYAVPWTSPIGMFGLVAILFGIYYSTTLRKQSDRLVHNFKENLSARERMQKSENGG